MDRWDGLDAFVAVAERESFTTAAEDLGVSTSFISRTIARLEERLQTRLLYRSTRRVTLTDTGQTFLQHCRQLQDGFDEAVRVVQDLGGEPKGLLRITCAVAYGERFVMPVVNQFMDAYPGLRIDMELTNDVRDIIQDGFDLAIRLGHVPESRLVATRLAPRSMYLCAAPSYVSRYGIPTSLAELGKHNCLAGTSDQWVFQVDGREVLFRVRGNWRCNSGQAVLDAALRGIGLCQLPDYYVYEHLVEGALQALLPEHHPPDTAVWALYPQRRHLSPKVFLLVDLLKRHLASLPPYQKDDGLSVDHGRGA